MFKRSLEPGSRRVQKGERVFFSEADIVPPEALFDVQTELTADRQEHILQYIETCFHLEDWLEFCKTVVSFETVLPGQIPARYFTEYVGGRIISCLSHETVKSHPDTSAQFMRVLYEFFPARTAEYEAAYSFDASLETLNRAKEASAWLELYERAYLTALLFPDRLSELPVSASSVDGLEKTLESIRQRSIQESNTRHFSLQTVLSSASRVAIVQPEFKDRFSFNVPMQRMAKEVFGFFEQHGGWGSMAEMSEHIACVTAGRVEIPSPGKIQCIPAEVKPLPKTPPLPPQKEYL